MRSEVLLPGLEFVVHQWNVGESSFVSKGDVIAILQKRGTCTSPGTGLMKTHLRPKIRGRTSSTVVTPRSHVATDQTEAANNMTPLLAPATGLLQKSAHEGPDTEISSLVLGFIVDCSHPAVIDTMCAICGQSILPKEATIPTAYDPTEQERPVMSQVTVSGGITMQISEAEAASLAQSQTERLLVHRRLSLVLDLDHTLVHATADQRASQYADRADVRTLLLPTENGSVMHHHVKLRPHLKEFLQEPLYEMTVYTAGTRLYAEQITMVLSRFMVGAELDHLDILQLQNRVKLAETKFQKKTAKRENNQEETMQSDSLNENTRTKSHDEGSSPPKKKVRFGKPAPTLRTDNMDITREDIDRLTAELRAAEEKENEALEMRQRVFGSRIFSRTDVGDLGQNVKSLKRIFPCGGTMSVIVDDREDVWANAEEDSKEPPHNLLVVRPYHWKPFAGFADVNNAAGVDMTKLTAKKGDSFGDPGLETDMQLLWTRDILQRVHATYYAHNGKKTVPEILKEMRYKTLLGCKIILSGLIPLHKQLKYYSGPRHPLMRYCEVMGAELMSSVDAKLTHVVAAADGSEKIIHARQIPGCYVVSPSWLMESLWSLTRRSEMDYLLGRPPLPVRTVGIEKQDCATGQCSSNGMDDDDDDDDVENDDELADELWDD